MSFKKRTAAGFFWREQGWVYGLLIVAGLGLGAVKLTEYQTASRIYNEGVNVDGLVTGLWSKPLGDAKTGPSYSVRYSFPTPDDPYTNGSQNVSKTFYETLIKDAEIAVRYLPTDPTISAVEPETVARAFWLAMALSVGLVIVGLGGGLHNISRARASVALRENGEVRTAKVTGHIIEGKKKKKGHMLWRDATGVSGRTVTGSLSDLLPVGSQITIFADPECHQKSIWEGDIGSRS
ncbi:DUF3592 domain-containing protein [Antarcticimicrobium sediminis]|uniref:DUF3592 domain-containing protein n=1 Tax=Antarcticimicrobium sediminis TaxID=2546227 RepID=A0A4R5EK75_9RHOB|nr:DUF3592 domain-containing protein [Antarcticimicrobium sediminis]TDE34807.1 DUF3592 domain-containing protein [Antarcticimicrobium sediminis]